VLSVPGGRRPAVVGRVWTGLLLLLPNHLETPERTHSQQGPSSDVVLYGVEQVVHLVHIATFQPPLNRANWHMKHEWSCGLGGGFELWLLLKVKTKGACSLL
jgi:hypothetical protein